MPALRALRRAFPDRTLALAAPAWRKRTVAAVMREVAELLGNTPAVARASYVDPRIVDLCHDGQVVAAPTEKAVRDLLS